MTEDEQTLLILANRVIVHLLSPGFAGTCLIQLRDELCQLSSPCLVFVEHKVNKESVGLSPVKGGCIYHIMMDEVRIANVGISSLSDRNVFGLKSSVEWCCETPRGKYSCH